LGVGREKDPLPGNGWSDYRKIFSKNNRSAHSLFRSGCVELTILLYVAIKAEMVYVT
jgi:hypothetical protein